MDSPITARAALLQALTSGEGYGLELIGRVWNQTNGRIVLNQGSVYPTLRELEAEGLLVSRMSDPIPERGGRPRIYYRLSKDGRKAALEQRAIVWRLFGEDLVG